ncbi:hypothetical protein QBC36DRAFT_84569 [Triangularia setosa]|uniref:DUF6594 domain-containing protein n=1 Tax=Triangularia setosa TaxID=2587417 RepID=A0AAN7A9K8_9PEZI|nr:hypothetical protein QBC36DRAFT_84569 [Podospora setosa]
MASKGFPGVVTFQEQHKNMEFIRNFSRLGKLLILDIGHELGARCDEIQALIEEEHKEEEQLCQTEGYKRPLGAGPVSEKVHDLLKSSRELYHEYMSTVKDYVYSKTKLHEAHLDPFFDMIEEFHCRGTLEKGDLAYYNSPEEICIITHPEPKWMMRLIYSCVGKWLIRKLPAKGFSQYSRHVPTATQNFIVCGMYILSTIVLILGPVSIMLLSELTKPETCALVVVSTIVFVVFASSMHQYQRAHTILAALGYLAVMAGFAEAAKQFLG